MRETCGWLLANHAVEEEADRLIVAANMTATIRAICMYVEHIDAVRDLTFIEVSTTEKLNSGLMERHEKYSTGEVSTPYMKSRGKYYIGYKEHYYTTDVIAYDF